MSDPVERLEIRESTRGYAVMALVTTALVVTLLATHWTLEGIPYRWVVGVMIPAAALFGWKALTTLARDPTIVIDNAGIADRRLKYGPISWSDIAEIRLKVIHLSPILHVTLTPGAAAKLPSSRATRMMGAGDLQIYLFSTIPDYRATSAFIHRLRPDLLAQSSF